MGRERLPREYDDPTIQPSEPDNQTGEEFQLDQDQEPAGDDAPDNEAEDAANPTATADEAAQLRQWFQALEQLVHEKSRQVDQLVAALDHAKAHVDLQARDQEEQDYLSHIRDLYEQDPVSATYHMIKKLQEDALNDYDSRMQQELHDGRHYSGLMEDLLAEPESADLRPHRRELEFLIREQGMDPETAALIVRSIADRGFKASAKRDAAARAVRNRSMVENAGEVGEPSKKDAEFDRILKKSKTLDEMFDRLSKIRL